MNVTGNTILITGGTSGIGLELAISFLRLRNTVIVTGRDRVKLDAVLSAHPGMRGVISDASDPNAIVELYQEITKDHPGLNVLINNAGLMRLLRLTSSLPIVDLTKEIDINLVGTIQMTQQFLPHLLAQKTAMIVNVSSGLAFVPIPISPIYSAAKAAVHAYTRCLRVQLQGSSVTVVELAPPLTETPLFNDEFKAMMHGANPMSVKRLVKHAITGIKAGKTEIRPGQSDTLKIASRLAPNMIFAEMSKVGFRP